MDRQKVLILGGNGFLGSHLHKRLIDSNRYEIYVPPRNLDLENVHHVQTLFNLYRWDIVFHLAAVQGSNPNCLDINKTITQNILNHINKKTRLIFASSSTVYGDIEVGRAASEFDQLIPTSEYGYSKLCSERYITNFHDNFVILRFCAICGPGNKKGLITDLINKVKNNPCDISTKKKIDVFGKPPGSTKPYIYVKDATHALEVAIDVELGIYNISSDTTISVLDAAHVIHNNTITYFNIICEFNNIDSTNDNKYVNLDNSLFKEKAKFSYLWPTSESAIIETVRKSDL
jgi:nucleoside-diphosphate-sugar epimerase